MAKTSKPGATAAFEKALADPQPNAHYVLRLYVAGMSTNSLYAIANIKKICEERLQGHYDLEVIDLHQHPELAQGEQIVAAPTLVKKLPGPPRRIIGNLSSTERVLLRLDLSQAG